MFSIDAPGSSLDEDEGDDSFATFPVMMYGVERKNAWEAFVGSLVVMIAFDDDPGTGTVTAVCLLRTVCGMW